MTGEMIARLEEGLHYSAIWYLEQGEHIELTDEEYRNVKTFEVLKQSVKDVSPDVMGQAVELAEKYSDLFEQAFTTMVSNVDDEFRPADATEFVRRLNEHIQFLAEESPALAP